MPEAFKFRGIVRQICRVSAAVPGLITFLESVFVVIENGVELLVAAGKRPVLLSGNLKPSAETATHRTESLPL